MTEVQALSVREVCRELTGCEADVGQFLADLWRTGKPIQPSIRFMADRLGWSERAVCGAVKRLYHLGLIGVSSVRGAGGLWFHNVYELVGDLLEAVKARAARWAALSRRAAEAAGKAAIDAYWAAYRAKKPGKGAHAKSADKSGSSFFDEKKKEPLAAQTAPLVRSAFAVAYERGDVKADMAEWRRQQTARGMR